MRVFICAVTLVFVLGIVIAACCTFIGIFPVLLFADVIEEALKKLTRAVVGF
jgi:ABC-type siderophore export system fused ATPase/permease subunit